jgi:hypothetical protein
MVKTLLDFFKTALSSKFSKKKNKTTKGGKSYCSLIFSFNNFNEPKVFLNHIGEEKLENVSITIFDAVKLKQINHLETTNPEAFTSKYNDCFNKYHFERIFPNALYPNIPVDFDQSKPHIDLVVEIRFANRFLKQTLIIENYKLPDRIIKNTIEENGKVLVQSQTGYRGKAK